jgi:hypothetical protein
LPTTQTLNKYGLTLEEWKSIYDAQNGECAICHTPLKRANIDHKHIRNWKHLKPEQRKQAVRGLLCFQCNYLLLNRMTTLPRLKQAVIYLEYWENRFNEIT